MPELTRRYIVMAMATDGPFDTKDPEAPFVLKPWKDPAALRALETYRDHCYSELAKDLTAWIEEISSGPAIRGGVGARNEQHMAAKVKVKVKVGGRGVAGHRPRPKVKVKAVRHKKPTKKGKRSR